MAKRRDDPIAFLHSNYIPVPFSGCWLWLGASNKRGYGVIGYQRQKALAHRLMLSFYQPNSDSSLNACHRCDVPACINPEHLFWGTQRDNLQDARKKARLGEYPRAPGIRHGMAKLTLADVTAIRTSSETTKVLGARYGVLPSHIWSIRNGRVWRSRP